ncbi:DUF6399 domain-containing protein [uncultured Thiohalocapsa sp.]|uniref:DUF6399 domain-containing protein n=1 Tax=uncultured Thiohalocapsa sp. TaxID=768990 RepID=UPI0025DA7FDA|nr:DUF6399 domain-containing protein [uncultured Thiohalocapsa sp.]
MAFAAGEQAAVERYGCFVTDGIGQFEPCEPLKQQHGHQRFSLRKQQVLTALHNFSTTRSDGTTTAERFCGQPHPSLFGQVLERIPWPARPERRLRPPAKPPALASVAA